MEPGVVAITRGRAISLGRLEHAFTRLLRKTQVGQGYSGHCPRPHDLRATFAVHRLIAWYREGADVQARLPLLSTYLGHVNVSAMSVYLTMTAELLVDAPGASSQFDLRSIRDNQVTDPTGQCHITYWQDQAPGQAVVQVPTYVRIIGTPAYTGSPPPPYLYNVNREILDQNSNPIAKVMFVMETYAPDPPSGNCTSEEAEKNNQHSTEGGTFRDEYTLGAGAPNPCSSSSTQSFKVRLNNVEYTIQTKYNVTWQYSGVTVTCSAGCV